jgi:hypothetical protein
VDESNIDDDGARFAGRRLEGSEGGDNTRRCESWGTEAISGRRQYSEVRKYGREVGGICSADVTR